MAGLWTRFFGSAGSQAVGVGLGTTAVPALLPAAQYLVNQAWHLYPDHPLLASTLAEGVAQGQVQYEWAQNEAQMTGINKDRFDRLVEIANVGPGMAEAFNLWRREVIDEDGFRRALKRLGLEQEWIDDLVKVHDVLLTPSELANARQQGFATPEQQIGEAALQGVSAARAEVQFQLAGLPPGPATMQDAYNRGLIDRETFDKAIREGHTKTKYTDLLFALKQPILTAAEYATLHLKGWINEEQMNAGGALHGYTPEQMHLLYLGRGRPAAPGQMATAAARGTVGPAGRPVDREQFITAIAQSDIRPEYGPMLWDDRFLYPPLFQITRLVQAGAIDPDTAADWARKDRYPPEVVTPLLQYWRGLTSQTGTSTNQTFVDKARAQLWARTHSSYLAAEISEQEARQRLPQAGVPAAEVDAVMALWNDERDVERKQLTPAQIKKAWQRAVVNPATGAPWTQDEALAALVGRGYSVADAQTFLNIPVGP